MKSVVIAPKSTEQLRAAFLRGDGSFFNDVLEPEGPKPIPEPKRPKVPTTDPRSAVRDKSAKNIEEGFSFKTTIESTPNGRGRLQKGEDVAKHAQSNRREAQNELS